MLATACDGVAAAAVQHALLTAAPDARTRSPVAWRTASKAAGGFAQTHTASLKATASEGALRSLAVEGELDELMMSDAPPRNASSASLAPSAAEQDESDGDDDWDAEAPAWPAASSSRSRARVALSSPRSAPIAVHRPAAGSATEPRGSFSAFSWRLHAPDAAADAVSGGAFMPPQWRGDAADGDGDEASPVSSSLPPLRALALRDCILRRTGFIEKESPPAASAQLPAQG